MVIQDIKLANIMHCHGKSFGQGESSLSPLFCIVSLATSFSSTIIYQQYHSAAEPQLSL
jgi:hypothetical protein